MKEQLEQVLPEEIEKRSFEMISEELGERVFSPWEEPIIKRCIHTSADLSMQTIWRFQKEQYSRLLRRLFRMV